MRRDEKNTERVGKDERRSDFHHPSFLSRLSFQQLWTSYFDHDWINYFALFFTPSVPSSSLSASFHILQFLRLLAHANAIMKLTCYLSHSKYYWSMNLNRKVV